LQLDLRELMKRGNGLFGSAEMTGSIGVVTLNMARLGHRYKGDMLGLIQETERLMTLAKSTLEKKRVFIQEMYDRGLFPYTRRYLPHLRNHFSTIGVNGMNEMVRNFTAMPMTLPTSAARRCVWIFSTRCGWS
jgi:anaerobic ribonucleoside-triphosphate reductase